MKIKKILATFMTGLLIAGSICVPGAQARKAKSSWPSGPSKNSLSCDSAIVMELSTGSVLYTKNIHKKHYPASITKIMTSLLTLENCSLSETLTFTEEEAYGIEMGSSSLYCVPGETFTIEQTLYGIMLQSANEMCLAAADHVAGSVDNFVDMMNARVAQLGLKDTHFMNPNGLHNDKHYTSAYDMACIAREAWKNTAFQKITGTKNYSIGSTNKRKAKDIIQLLNHHQMVNGYEHPEYQYKYCVGGKTGYTSMAHSTLVTYAEKDGMQLVAVIMKANSPKQGEPNEYTDTTRLLNFAFEKYKKYSVNEENNSVNENLFNTFDSYFNTSESPIRLASESSIVLPKGVDVSKASQKVTYDKDVKLVKGENTIGTVTYTYGGRTVGSTNIIYDNTDSTNHLDEASRELVSNKIQQIETKASKHAAIYQRFLGLRTGFGNFINFFKERIVLLVVILLVLILLILVVTRYLISPQAGRRKRIRRSKRSPQSSGSRGGSRKNISFSKKKRRRRGSLDYTTSGRRNSGIKRTAASKGVNPKRLKKSRRKTRESFGRSFYDFK